MTPINHTPTRTFRHHSRRDKSHLFFSLLRSLIPSPSPSICNPICVTATTISLLPSLCFFFFFFLQLHKVRRGWVSVLFSFWFLFGGCLILCDKNWNKIKKMSSALAFPVSASKRQAVFITSLIVFWYSSNIGVLLLNKFLLSNYGFSFPIFLTMCHMSACAVLSYISIVVMKVVPFQRIKSRSQFFRISTLSVVFCASVVGGNISLRYLPVSFNQAVGATTPFFTALFAYFMTLKREAWITYACLVPVVGGVIIASGVCFLPDPFSRIPLYILDFILFQFFF